MTAAGSLDDLPTRDLAVLRDLRRVRLLTGKQLERLHFCGLHTPNSRGSARRRSLNRLAGLGLVTTLGRRVGGERAGSAGLVYLLDGRGWRLLDAHDGSQRRRRRPWPVGQLFVAHTLAISELYVRLREAEQVGRLELLRFDAEPDAWHRSAIGVVKPDAYAVVLAGRFEDHFWLEVDRGTESLPTLRRKLQSYVEVALSGDTGPDGVLPRVVVTVETAERLHAVAALLRSLPAPGEQLVSVTPFGGIFRSDDVSGADNKGPP